MLGAGPGLSRAQPRGQPLLVRRGKCNAPGRCKACARHRCHQTIMHRTATTCPLSACSASLSSIMPSMLHRLTVLDGSVVEERYQPAQQAGESDSSRSSAPDIPGVLKATSPCPQLAPAGSSMVAAGATAYINDSMALHAVRCSEHCPAPGAVTLHVYAPPIRRVKLFEVSREGLCNAINCVNCAAAAAALHAVTRAAGLPLACSCNAPDILLPSSRRQSIVSRNGCMSA